MAPTHPRVKTPIAEPLAERGYHSILLAADASDHANRGTSEAVALAGFWGAQITGTHVYAAKMHDLRFRQMEGGLPEQFREEEELERQRDIHDDLISRGLTIITDSYLDQAEKACAQTNIRFERRALEGKNYRALAKETNSNRYDLLVMGARGLGAIPGERVGTVCARVVRRSRIDTLVIKNPETPLGRGPIVVAIDGSKRSFGGLLTGIELAKKWGVALHVISAFDPYYHYVAFNRIAGVLSEEAGRVFRFQEQEQLHEEIIDSGLAKIYEGHLTVALSIAKECGIPITTKLLDGKPHDAVNNYVNETNPSLLVVGRTGVHADDDLDIGGNTEHLLQNAACSLLISERDYQPPVETLADASTSWTVEAEERMLRVPSFARSMAKTAILRQAQKQGHTVITASMVDEISDTLCPAHGDKVMREIVEAHDQGELKHRPAVGPMPWSSEATTLLGKIANGSEQDNIKSRAQKRARRVGSLTVERDHVTPFVSGQSQKSNQKAPFHWEAAALARLTRVPEGFMRDTTREKIEHFAQENTLAEITLETVESALAMARAGMSAKMNEGESSSGKCPFGYSSDNNGPVDKPAFQWDQEASVRLQNVPVGFMRDLTRQRVEQLARRKGISVITSELMDDKYAEWAKGSEQQAPALEWDDSARQTINKIPDFVRGMVIKEVEQCALKMGLGRVTQEVLSRARNSWSSQGSFHSEAHPDQYDNPTSDHSAARAAIHRSR